MKILNRLFIVVIIVSIAIIFVFFVDFKNQDNLMNKLQCKLYDKNTIEIRGFIGNISDLEIHLYSGKVVFKDGRKIASIPREYGSVDFLVYLKHKLIGQAGIDNYNWWHSHDFIFEFNSQKTEKFSFKVIGPNSNSLYYKYIINNKENSTQTEIFYDKKGVTGQINKNHYNKFNELTFDEIWINDTLVNLNIYKRGVHEKNYSTNIIDKDTKYILDKIDRNGLIEFEFKTITKDSLNTERIKIKN